MVDRSKSVKPAIRRAGQMAALVAAVTVLSSGCLIQRFHISDEHASSQQGPGPCATFRPQVSGTAFATAVGVTAPPNVVVGVGIQQSAPGSNSSSVTVWSNSQPVLANLGPVTAGATYSLWVSSYGPFIGAPADYDTDVGVVLSIKDDQGNDLPIECIPW